MCSEEFPVFFPTRQQYRNAKLPSLAESISTKRIKRWTGFNKLHQASHPTQFSKAKVISMCHSHRQRYYASPTCYRKSGCRRPHGCRHRRCAERAIIQSAPITRLPSTQVMGISTVPPMTREIVPEKPALDEEQVVSDPPPYSEHDRSHVPEAGRGYAQCGIHEPIPLEKLEKEPGYVVVFPPSSPNLR
jgi:hypothetical protein